MAVHMAVKCTFILWCHLKWHIFGWCVCASESIRCSCVFVPWYLSSVFRGVHIIFPSCTILNAARFCQHRLKSAKQAKAEAVGGAQEGEKDGGGEGVKEEAGEFTQVSRCVEKVRMSWYLGYIHEGRAGRKRAGMGSLDQGRGRRKPQRGGCPQCLASKRWNPSLQRWYTGISLSANPSANRVLNLTLMRMWNPNSKPQKYDPSHGADEKNVQHLECFVVGPKKSFQDSNLPRGPGLPCRCCERRTRPILSRLQKKA